MTSDIKKIFEDACSYKQFKDIVDSNKLDYSCLNTILNYDRVLSFINSQKIDCSKGQNINDCQQEIKGKKISLKYKGNIFYPISCDCQHQLKFNDNNGWKNMYAHKNFSWETIENIKRPKIPTNFKEATEKVESILNGKTKKGIYISGGDPLERNNFLKLISMKIAKSKTQSELFGKKIYFDSFSNIVNDLKESFNDNNNLNKLNVNKIKNSDILFIDNLGGENPSQWTIDDVLISIISHRYENKLLTFIASDYTITQLIKYYDSILNETKNKRDINKNSCKKLSSYMKNLISEVKINEK